MNKYNAQIGAGGTQYAYYHEEDESSFQLVSNLHHFYNWAVKSSNMKYYVIILCA